MRLRPRQKLFVERSLSALGTRDDTLTRTVSIPPR